MAPSLGVGLLVGVIALERRQPVPTDDLADGIGGVQQPVLGIEVGSGALEAGVGIEDDDVQALGRPTQGIEGHAAERLDDHAALARAVALHDVATEATSELLAVAGRRLRAETPAQLVVAVLRRLGLGEDVRQGSSHVVEVGAPVTAHVAEEG